MGKNIDTVFLLEMVVQTATGMINEPIGAYENEEDCQKYLQEAQSVFNSSVVFNVIPMKINERPPILEIEKSRQSPSDLMIGLELFELYDIGVIEQMVDENGDFSYQLSNKSQAALEKMISKNF